MAVVPFIHWNVTGAVLVASTLNCADCPTVTTWPAGGVTMARPLGCAATLSCAPLAVGPVVATTLNVAEPLFNPFELAVTVTVPGVNCARTATFARPPSADRFGSPGA